MNSDVVIRFQFQQLNESVQGSVVSASGEEVTFVGWLELLAVLEEVLESLRGSARAT